MESSLFLTTAKKTAKEEIESATRSQGFGAPFEGGMYIEKIKQTGLLSASNEHGHQLSSSNSNFLSSRLSQRRCRRSPRCWRRTLRRHLARGARTSNLSSLYPLIHPQADTQCTRIASFHIGSRVTALAWSSATISPTSSDEWLLE